MKVTKLIREYVTDEVGKVYNSKVNPYSEQAEIDRQKLKALTEELRTQQKESIEKFLSENEVFENGWGGVKRYEIQTSVPIFSYLYTKAMLDEKNWKEDNKKAKDSKVRDIILSLELGANRQELNEMIAKLMED